MRSENHPHDALEIKASRLAMAIGVASSRRPHRRYRQWRICHPPIPRDGLSAAKPRWWQLCAAAGSRWRKLCFATNYRRRSSSPGSVRSRRTALSACVPRAFGNTAGRVHRQPPAHDADATSFLQCAATSPRRRQIAATLAATLSLAACVAPPAAPTIPVAPGRIRRRTGSTPIRPPARNTPLRKSLPRWPPLTPNQSAERY